MTRPKKENPIGIISVKLEHNHEMNSLINEMAPKFQKFTQLMHMGGFDSTESPSLQIICNHTLINLSHYQKLMTLV